MGALPKRKLQACAYDNCDSPIFCSGVCQRHYNWEYYHRVRGHGVAYMKKRAVVLEELAGRCRQATRSKLKAVK